VLGGILLGVGDEQRAVDVFDAEGREVAGDRAGPRGRIDERVGAEVYEVEARIKDVDGAVMEVGRENERALRVRTQGQQ
jgi:hypothetical protein